MIIKMKINIKMKRVESFNYTQGQAINMPRMNMSVRKHVTH